MAHTVSEDRDLFDLSGNWSHPMSCHWRSTMGWWVDLLLSSTHTSELRKLGTNYKLPFSTNTYLISESLWVNQNKFEGNYSITVDMNVCRSSLFCCLRPFMKVAVQYHPLLSRSWSLLIFVSFFSVSVKCFFSSLFLFLAFSLMFLL